MDEPRDYTWGQIRKTVVAAGSASAVILSLAMAQGDVIPEGWMKWAVLIINVASAYGVFKVENDPIPPAPAGTEPPSQVTL